MSALATPEVITRRVGRPPEGGHRVESTFHSKSYRVHSARCHECRAIIIYTRDAKLPPDRWRRCCDCLRAHFHARVAR